MSLWQAFGEICAQLRAEMLKGPPIRRIESSWEEIVEISSLFYVLPAVAYCLKQRPDLPDAVASYFGSVHFLNVRRNQAILDTLEPTLRSLQSVGIDPILLKGSSLLVAELYPPGARFVGDADLLVSSERADQAYQTLLLNDYTPLGGPLPPEGHRHLPPVVHRTTGLAVELHTRIEYSATEFVMPLSWFIEGCRTVPFRSLSVRVPDPTRLVGVNFVHNPVNDYGRVSPIELRWLLDLAVIRARHEEAIDWVALDRLASNAGHADLFATYLAFDEAFFGHQAPPTTGRPQPQAMIELREYVDPWERELPAGVDVGSYAFSGRDAEHVEGHCWRVTLPPEFLPGDNGRFDRTSSLELFENDRKLRPAFAAPKIIREKGRGSYAHRGRELFFSPADNADLRTTDRRFVAKGWIDASPDVVAYPRPSFKTKPRRLEKP